MKRPISDDDCYCMLHDALDKIKAVQGFRIRCAGVVSTLERGAVFDRALGEARAALDVACVQIEESKDETPTVEKKS